ncbi:MAG: hypothetical protein JSU70_15415 [Phycisphaerales bacterium]|nr:MAG: hypothetical protein JSU70_15415 [Phycisphaerales bacterium]
MVKAGDFVRVVFQVLRTVVAGRFVVEMAGTGVTMETIKQAMGQIDLEKPAEMANSTRLWR